MLEVLQVNSSNKKESWCAAAFFILFSNENHIVFYMPKIHLLETTTYTKQAELK